MKFQCLVLAVLAVCACADVDRDSKREYSYEKKEYGYEKKDDGYGKGGYAGDFKSYHGSYHGRYNGWLMVHYVTFFSSVTMF